MNIVRENWFNAELFTYQVKCEKCKRILIFRQNGNPLCKNVLQYINKIAHIDEQLDSFCQYWLEEKIQINVDILNNVQCVKDEKKNCEIVKL